MQSTDIQRLLAAAGYYNRAIDGIMGEKSWTAVNRVLQGRSFELPDGWQEWNPPRMAIAAAQLILKYANHPVGAIDGLWGNLTAGALLEWNHWQVYNGKLVLDQKPIKEIKTKFPSQSECNYFYGNPGVAIQQQLISVPLPFVLRLDWDLSTTVDSVRLHEKCAESAEEAFKQVYKVYGEARIRVLGLDRYAGGYNHRRMRGGKSWSMHAYGCAMDFWALPNGLTTRCPAARFCGDEYTEFFDIWESYGWVSLGRAIGRDWMHIQAASL